MECRLINENKYHVLYFNYTFNETVDCKNISLHKFFVPKFDKKTIAVYENHIYCYFFYLLFEYYYRLPIILIKYFY